MTSIEQSDLPQQRQKLPLHSRVQMFQAVWRTLAAGSLLGGLVWGATQPIWILRESNQVVILGTHLLSAQAIRSILPLSYPKSLLQVEPKAIARALKSQPTIVQANVTRQLFPPGVTVQIQERVPVALALTKPSTGNSTLNSKVSTGLVDENGVWMSMQSYALLSSTLALPNLKVIGLPEQYGPYWTPLYQAVSHSPIKVAEIDCRDQANLIMKTELGIVHFGSYSSQLVEQLNILAQMRQISTRLNASQIVYINLKNPKHPSVQTNQTSNTVKSGTQ